MSLVLTVCIRFVHVVNYSTIPADTCMHISKEEATIQVQCSVFGILQTEMITMHNANNY